MKSNVKKILIVFVIVIAISIGAYFGYKQVSPIITSVQKTTGLPVGGSKGTSQTNQNISSNVPTGNGTGILSYEQQHQNLSLLTNSSPMDYWISSSTSTATSTAFSSRIFYVNQNGEIVEIKGPLQEEVISASSYGTSQKIFQSIDGQKAAIKFKSGEVAIFDVKTKVWRDLGPDISSVAFSPDGTKLAILKYSANSANIYTLSLASTKTSLSLMASLSARDFSILWPDKNRIFLISKQSHDSIGQIWYLNINNKTVNLLAEGNGIGVVFSDLFNYVVEFVAKGPTDFVVSLVDKSGVKLADMYLNTISQKCSFSYDQKQIYCAVPYENNKETGLVLPDDYLMGAVYFHDGIYKIDVDTLSTSLILNLPDKMIDASNLKEARNQLFFINRLDGQLYVLKVNEQSSSQ
jgi:hypothetical protein